MFSKIVLALSLGVSAQALSEREQMVAEINAIEGLTWKAGLSDKFKDQPIGASRILYGAHKMSEGDMASAIARGDLEVAPIVDAATAASIPDEFDSATNWPECAKTINDIRDQSNCGCCWAFGAASAASDRACIATGGQNMPFSAQDVCFNAERSGCNGGQLYTPWSFIKSDGVVTGGQYLDDIARDDPNFGPSDPFDGEGWCASFSLPHCFHHGPENTSPYPAEGDEGCPSVTRSPKGPTKCDENSTIADYSSDKYTFDGRVTSFPNSEETIQNAIMTDGPVEAAFTVYSDFENYVSGIYQHVRGSMEGGHAIRIVGWGVEDGTKYWKVANSWNPYWGEEGYFRILRGSNECGIESQVYASSSGSKWAKKN